MCSNCEHNAQFLTKWKTFIVQCSYANAALLLLARAASCSTRTGSSADSLNQRFTQSARRLFAYPLKHGFAHSHVDDSPIRAITYSPIRLFA